MHLDVPTLMAIGVFVTLVAGFLLFFAWLGDRAGRALLWWAAGDLVWAVGVALILAMVFCIWWWGLAPDRQPTCEALGEFLAPFFIGGLVIGFAAIVLRALWLAAS